MAPRKDAKQKEKSPAIPLAQPDRSGPSQETLIEWATTRNLFAQADAAQANANSNSTTQSRKKGPKVTKINARSGAHSGDDGDDEESENGEEYGLTPGQERVMDAFLWSVSLTMLHFTLDVFVYNQYGQELEWTTVIWHTPPAFALITLMFWVMHETPANRVLIPTLPMAWQHQIRQIIFAIASVCAGCYVIHITNNHGYVAVMRQTPICGVIWIWSVIELDLRWALLTGALELIFVKMGGYSIY